MSNSRPAYVPRIRVNHALEEKLSAAIQKSWLSRARKWAGFQSREGEHHGWYGVKVLGAGTFGVCGLFAYWGSSPTTPRYLVVKQGQNLRSESNCLRRLGHYSPQHVVKLYKAALQSGEGGSGTTDADGFDPYFDKDQPLSQTIDRIYLEYCPGGELPGFGSYPVDDRICRAPEEHLWRLLHCMAKGLLMMITGSEDPLEPRWNASSGETAYGPIIHFDIKPENCTTGPLSHPSPANPLRSFDRRL